MVKVVMMYFQFSTRIYHAIVDDETLVELKVLFRALGGYVSVEDGSRVDLLNTISGISCSTSRHHTNYDNALAMALSDLVSLTDVDEKKLVMTSCCEPDDSDSACTVSGIYDTTDNLKLQLKMHEMMSMDNFHVW